MCSLSDESKKIVRKYVEVAYKEAKEKGEAFIAMNVRNLLSADDVQRGIIREVGAQMREWLNNGDEIFDGFITKKAGDHTIPNRERPLFFSKHITHIQRSEKAYLKGRADRN